MCNFTSKTCEERKGNYEKREVFADHTRYHYSPPSIEPVKKKHSKVRKISQVCP
eukprot:TRINITY_DN7607_c0_g1_i1.p2 TRINITY_DN7607_c0_g1~~TRINITY_DN7607_c0_g1_i1.p2  ORF type:complete len:54 (+),score=7.67 TRINITY_DN7607_c0_g1_i1:237-398(+)